MDYDAIIIGSGFGGAITGCRLAEAGVKAVILERGRWWDKKDSPGRTAYPRSARDPWLWSHDHPERHNGWLDFRVFPNMSVAQGAAVGGGSLIYANISCEPRPDVFNHGWPAEITYAELKPHYDTVAKFMNVQQVPDGQWTKKMELMKIGADAIGEGHRFQKLELAVSFDPDYNYGLDDPHNVDRHSKRFVNAQGVEQGTCVHVGNCDIGCEADARNTLDRNYIPWGMKHGLEVRPLHLVSTIMPADGGYRVNFDRLENGQRFPGSLTAKMVIVAAGSMGSTELMLRCRDQHHTLPNISQRLGHGWSSNGDFLTPAIQRGRTVNPTKGPTIASAINFLDRSFEGESFWVQDGGFPDVLGNALDADAAGDSVSLQARLVMEGIRQALRDVNALGNIMPWFAQAVDAADGVLRLHKKFGVTGPQEMTLDWDIVRSRKTIDSVVAMHTKLAHATGGIPLVSPTWSIGHDLVTPHPLGGCNVGNTAANGVVAHTGEVFGYPNLFVADAAIIPEALGVNPSRTIGALAERIAKLIVSEKG